MVGPCIGRDARDRCILAFSGRLHFSSFPPFGPSWGGCILIVLGHLIHFRVAAFLLFSAILAIFGQLPLLLCSTVLSFFGWLHFFFVFSHFGYLWEAAFVSFVAIFISVFFLPFFPIKLRLHFFVVFKSPMT